MPNVKKLLSDIHESYDSFVNGLSIITTDHKYIHEGKKFNYCKRVSIGAGADYFFTFKTPTEADGKQVHWRPPIVSDSADKLSIDLYKNSTVNSAGTEAKTSINNYNETSSNESLMQSFQFDVDISDNGTMVYLDYIGGGSGAGGSTRSGGATSEKEERPLDFDTNYTVVVNNGSSGTNIVNFIFNWYEEVPIT